MPYEMGPHKVGQKLPGKPNAKVKGKGKAETSHASKLQGKPPSKASASQAPADKLGKAPKTVGDVDASGKGPAGVEKELTEEAAWGAICELDAIRKALGAPHRWSIPMANLREKCCVDGFLLPFDFSSTARDCSLCTQLVGVCHGSISRGGCWASGQWTPERSEGHD